MAIIAHPYVCLVCGWHFGVSSFPGGSTTYCSRTCGTRWGDGLLPKPTKPLRVQEPPPAIKPVEPLVIARIARIARTRTARCGHDVPSHGGQARKACDPCTPPKRVPWSPSPRNCERCAIEFIPKSRTVRFCSSACPARKHDPICTIPGCGRAHLARGLCGTHYIQAHQPKNHGTPAVCEQCGAGYMAARRTQRFCSLLCRSGGEFKNVWTDAERRKSREKQRMRRAVCNAVDAEEIDELAIYARDRWVCGICNRSVDPEIRWPDPACPSLDHVVPISEGGAHKRANVRLTHLRCNIVRGNRGDSVQLALIG